MPTHADDLMAVFQVTIAIGVLDFKIAVVAKEFIAGSNINVIAIESDSAQTPIRTAAFEIDIAGIPVDMLLAGLRFKIDRINTAVTLTLLAATYYGCCNEFG